MILSRNEVSLDCSETNLGFESFDERASMADGRPPRPNRRVKMYLQNLTNKNIENNHPHKKPKKEELKKTNSGKIPSPIFECRIEIISNAIRAIERSTNMRKSRST
jgi:hypothetical protein